MTQQETFWLTVIVQIQTIFILICVIIFWVIPKRGRSEFFELGLLLMISLAFEIIGSVGIHFIHTNMNVWLNAFDLFYLPLVILLYKRKVSWAKKETASWITIAGFLIIALINLFAISGPTNFNGYTTALVSASCIMISLGYFYFLIQQLPTSSIVKLPMFWINTALLTFNSATFVFFLTTDYLIRVLKNNLVGFWIFHHSFGVIYLCMLIYALLLIRREHVTTEPATSH